MTRKSRVYYETQYRETDQELVRARELNRRAKLNLEYGVGADNSEINRMMTNFPLRQQILATHREVLIQIKRELE